MTVLSACQNAAKLMGMGAAAPTAIFNSTAPFSIDMSVVANEAAVGIMKSHDWRKLTVLHTQAGDGSDTSFALPSDYDRMPLKSKIFSTAPNLPLCPVEDLDQWQEIVLHGITTPVGSWIILGGELQIRPALASGESAKLYYISNLIVTPESGDNKAAFTLDTDTFRLSERLLTLAIIWRWRALKGLDYSEEMRNYEIAFSEEAGREKGSRILTVGQQRFPGNLQATYPGTIDA
jgi:hypothetical protein